MIIRNNTDSRRTGRYLSTNQTAIGKTLEKLSSGYRINRSADDAAGLAISEKMRLNITGLGRARLNSMEGTKLIQTGEGALQEIQDMLHRAEYMATQSANGTYEDALDRENLQKELEHICSEIDRISKEAKFNTIELFQDVGLEGERTYPQGAGARELLEAAASAATQEAADVSAKESGPKLVVKIECIEHDVVTTQTPGGGDTLAQDVTIGGKSLSEILKTEIVPNTVNAIVSKYGDAFSYLSGSKIGIGLEYFSQGAVGGATTLAYVKGQVGSSGSVSGSTLISRSDYITYTLGVNISAVDPTTWASGGREELEATIAHEMIHAFMDEAATAGMFGKQAVNDQNLTKDVEKFPDWFIEGMAQTASGPGNWLASGGGLGISASSTEVQIKSAIATYELGANSNANNYGTGYLACMYLGAVIGGYNGTDTGSSTVAATVANGVSQLLKAIVSGKSLNSAIKDLTCGKFSSLSDFQTQFNSGSAEGMTAFVHNLMVATGTTGRGSILTGDLGATNLVDDTTDSNTLFGLTTDSKEVKNVYPDGYNVYSGGSASAEGTAPTDFNPPTPPVPAYIDYGKLRIYGITDSADIEYNANTKELTIKAGNGIKITMDGTGTDSINKINLGKDPADNISATFVGVDLSGNGSGEPGGKGALSITGNCKVSYEGKNTLGDVTVVGNGTADFTGSGQIKAESFAGGSKVDFHGGAVIVNGGSGTITSGAITVDGTAIAATLNPAPASQKNIGIDWSKLNGLGDIASIKIGSQKYDMSLDQNTTAQLWLNPDGGQRVTFTDVNGVAKTLATEKLTDGTLQWKEVARPFTVTKADGTTPAVEGTDYEYADDGKTLIIKSAVDLVISGGNNPDENGTPITGARIKIADNITGNVNLTLKDCKVDVSATGERAFDLGKNNTVNLTLADNTENVFKSGNNCAGISVGEKTNLTITGSKTTSPAASGSGAEVTNTTAGKLSATGGRNGAGIGRDGADYSNKFTDTDSSIKITGGNITAIGGIGGAGIGAGYYASIGDIEISDATVNAHGGSNGGAGIGGSAGAPVGNIKISNSYIEQAKSDQHGAGIGGGWTQSASNGNIEIIRSTVKNASGVEHGTGIGAGCQGTSGYILIEDSDVTSQGGDYGAGIGSSWNGGTCGDITIRGASNINATGGDNGAGIGAGNANIKNTKVGDIIIDTTGTVRATGGTNGVGIGSGLGESSNTSSCGDIKIMGGTVIAKGSNDSTGIGAGRGSTSGDVFIGDPSDPDKMIVVSATGGMTNNGGNIMSYKDKEHKTPGNVAITGKGTSVQPGRVGEGLYSTSGVEVDDGNGGKVKLYSYPLCIFKSNVPTAKPDPLLDASVTLTDKKVLDYIPLAQNATITKISAVDKNGTSTEWSPNITHAPAGDSNYVYLWMTDQDQTLTIEYDDGAGNTKTVTLDLKFYPKAGEFRVDKIQAAPPDAKPPEYTTNPDPPKPDPPDPPDPGLLPEPEPEKPKGPGGIILQIGANYGEILEVPRFYLSARALELDKVDISTQQNAWDSMPVLKNATNRVSSIRGEYGALQNRLEHNQNDLSQAAENLTDAESRIRDADMAEEYTKLVKLNILQQSAQAMLSHSNQDANRVMQLFQ